MPGVTKTVVGYTGGKAPSPTYESVCGGDGHTEAIQIEYDPQKIKYEDLLQTFYKGCSADSRGQIQYKSAVWVHSDEQRKVVEDSAQKHGKANLQVMDAQKWHDAEGYHQKYYTKNGGCSQQ